MHKKLHYFIVTLVASLCCSFLQAQTISISSSTSDTICSGTSVTFTAVTSGTHFQWLKNSVVITGATSATYTTTTLANGDVIMCELVSTVGGTIIALSAPIVMTVEHMPVVAAISGPDTVCHLATITLTDDTSGGVWNASNAFIASISSSGVVTGVAPGLDTITYTLTNSCGSASATVHMYVNTPPFLAPITGPATICLPATATFVDSPAIGVWNVSNPGVGTISTAGVLTSLSVGVDTILYSAANSCGTTTRRRPVGVLIAPIVPAISGGNTVCQNDTVHLRDLFPGGTWHSQNNMVAGVMAGGPGGNTGVVRGMAGGTATIVYVVADACGVDSATLDVTVNPLPFVYPIIGRDSVCPGDTDVFIEVTPGGTWSSMNSAIATVDASGIVIGVVAGIDSIFYSVTNSCGTVTQAMSVAVYCPDVSVPVVPVQKAVMIYPNPAHDMFSITGIDPALVQLVNIYGQTVSSTRNTNTISVSNLPEGVYFVNVFDERGNVVLKQQLVKW